MTKLKITIVRALLIFLALIVIVITGSVLYIAYTTHSSTVNFQEYAPTYLPAGISITSRTMDVWSDKTNSLSHTKILTLDLNTSHSFISEEKDSGFSYLCDNVTNQSCADYVTPNNQRYQLATVYDRVNTTTPFEQNIAWVKNGTHIWITTNGYPAHIYSQDTWGRVVDSFKAVKYSKLHINQYSPGP